MDELEKLREKIDKLDKTIADLIYKRQSLSSEILKSKRGKFTYDPVREKKLMNKIFSYNINQKLAERIWRQIIGYNLSEQKKLKIGFIKNDRFSLAAYDAYFGPYFDDIGFENEKDLILELKQNKIDLAIVDKSSTIFDDLDISLQIVSEFPLIENFYKKKYFILK